MQHQCILVPNPVADNTLISLVGQVLKINKRK
jgi:hypothetical protein